MGEPTNEPPTEAAPVARVRDAVKVAQGIQAIADRELLVDPETAPDPHVSRLRDRLLRRRQRASLRHRHRTARRAEKAVDFDAAMDDKGHRELRKRQLATSPARKAANLAKIQTAVIGVAVPAVIGFGAASTAGVHAFMTEYAAASAAAAWGYEPAVITLVSGVIIVRALLLRNGAVLPPVVTWIERGALASSVIMCLIGSGVGAIFAPLGVALVSVVVERILAAIADADVGDTPGTATRPVQPRASATVPMTSQVPRWVSVSPGVRVRAGGPRVGNYLTPPPGAVLLPVECASHARERARVLAEGAAAVAQLESWRDRDRAAATRTRMRNEALAAAAGGGAARALTRGAGESTASSREGVRHAGSRDVTGGSHNTPEAPVDTVPESGVGGHQIDAEQGFDGLPDSDDRESTEKVIPAVEGRRLAGLRTRYRIAEHMAAHPDHTASQIAEALGLGESTVYRHKRTIEAEAGGEE